MSDQSLAVGPRTARAAAPAARFERRLRRAERGYRLWFLIFVAAASWVQPVHAERNGFEGRVTQDMQIEFVTPADWRCTKRGACTNCRNVTEHPTAIRIGAVNESTRWTQTVPAAAELEICSPDDAGNTDDGTPDQDASNPENGEVRHIAPSGQRPMAAS